MSCLQREHSCHASILSSVESSGRCTRGALSPLQQLRQEDGIFTLDFIFALVIASTFTMVFFALAVTFSVVEVTQYITFSTARCYNGAHETQQAQQTLAQNKYKQLMAIGVFKSIFAAGWFKVDGPTIGDFNSEYPQSGDLDSATFIGARVKLTANILNVRTPFLGSTATDSTTGVSNVSTYLSREVTTTECRENFDRSRFAKLKALSNSYGPTPANSSILITDNGC